MKLKISEKNSAEGPLELALKGELTIYSVKLLKEKLNSLGADFQKIDIEMSEVTKIDTAGFQLLESALKSGNTFSFKSCGDEVNKILIFFGEKI
jgi:anti-anti-sigma regulatory factor